MNGWSQGHFHSSNIWQNFPFTWTFWSCVSKNSKKFHVFFKFVWNFHAQILKICKIHWKLRVRQTPVLLKDCIFMNFFWVVLSRVCTFTKPYIQFLDQIDYMNRKTEKVTFSVAFWEICYQWLTWKKKKTNQPYNTFFYHISSGKKRDLPKMVILILNTMQSLT